MTGPVAVLGAGGFIGNRTVEMLHLERRIAVRPVVRSPEKLALAARFALDLRLADARDEAALTTAFRGCSAVVHAVAGDPETIVGSVAPVYRAAAAAGVRRVVYLSSASVHGQAPAPGTDETSPLSDRQPIAYNNAKVRAERALADLRRGGGVETVVLRPGIVHGPRSYWTGGFADDLLAGTAYLVDGGGGICNAAYVDNVVHAIALAIAAPSADGGTYLVGDAETVTWRGLCEPVAAALGFALDPLAVSYAPRRPGLVARLRQAAEPLRPAARRLPPRIKRALRAGLAAYAADGGTGGPRAPDVTLERALLHTCATRLPYDKAARELGYAPVVDFAEACRRSVAWLAFAGYPVVEPNRGRGP